ncbi:hypothetical protein K492DRAFT_194340 [Lichtheimia hyalospora FSU 10163]|nr:hypothetical protein K492DRAFT_194340 [Lichtheimia hyalospora FSU 10163]
MTSIEKEGESILPQHHHSHNGSHSQDLKGEQDVDALAIRNRSLEIIKPTNRQHRVSCADLAADIGDTLVTEVRKLRDAQSKNLERIAHLETSLGSLQQENQLLKHKYQKLEKDQEQLKDQEWSLEIARQELQEQLENKDAKVIRLTSEKTKLLKELQNMEMAKAEDDNNSATASHLHEQRRHRLITELQQLKKENATLQLELNDMKSYTKTIIPHNDHTQSSITHHHYHLELNKLKHSLAHAHRTMADLRMAVNKEKKGRMETAKLLAESQHTIEELTATPHDLNHKRKSGDKVLKQQQYDDNNTGQEEEACNTTDRDSSLDVLPTTSATLFNELQQSNNTPSQSSHDKGTQTDGLLDYVDMGIQVTMPEEEEHHSYLDSLKRVWNESSISLKHAMSSHYASSEDIRREQDHTPHSPPPPAISSNHSSKLATYAAKYVSHSPHPVSSISMQHPRAIVPQWRTSSSNDHDDLTNKPTPSISDTMAGASIHKHHMSSDIVSATTTNDVRDKDQDIDPQVIQALTHAMIGDWIYKYTRRYVAGKAGNRRHYRYFWIHPYTKTLYWSYTQPDVDHDESRSKRAFIRDVYNIPCPQPSSTPFHLMVRTPTRDIVLQAIDIDQHQRWLVAFCFLLDKSVDDVATTDHTSPLLQSSVSLSHRFSRGYSPSNNNSSLLTSSIVQHSTCSDENDWDDSEDELINIRQCCNGKHDISKLARD